MLQSNHIGQAEKKASHDDLKIAFSNIFICPEINFTLLPSGNKSQHVRI